LQEEYEALNDRDDGDDDDDGPLKYGIPKANQEELAGRRILSVKKRRVKHPHSPLAMLFQTLASRLLRAFLLLLHPHRHLLQAINSQPTQ